jgi:hypothetical protein
MHDLSLEGTVLGVSADGGTASVRRRSARFFWWKVTACKGTRTPAPSFGTGISPEGSLTSPTCVRFTCYRPSFSRGYGQRVRRPCGRARRKHHYGRPGPRGNAARNLHPPGVDRGRGTDRAPDALRAHRPLPVWPQTTRSLVRGNWPCVQMRGAGRSQSRRACRGGIFRARAAAEPAPSSSPAAVGPVHNSGGR